jgi:branched-chain amino acid transport system ATP-binding protein
VTSQEQPLPFASQALLSLDRISLSFGGVKAITDISFDVRQGEICALIGPNGAGKSSLLNVINGVYRPQQGTVRMFGVRQRVKSRPALSVSMGFFRA